MTGQVIVDIQRAAPVIGVAATVGLTSGDGKAVDDTVGAGYPRRAAIYIEHVIGIAAVDVGRMGHDAMAVGEIIAIHVAAEDGDVCLPIPLLARGFCP